MIQIVREFIVKADTQAQFELVFGPGGAWSKLFGKTEGFRGTTMLNDTHHPTRYLIFDLWDTEEQHQQALNEGVDDYAKLNADLANWTESRTELGVFRMRAEATVRSVGTTSRRNRRPSR